MYYKLLHDILRSYINTVKYIHTTFLRVLKKQIEFKFVGEVVFYEVKQTKTNLQKYFNPFSVNQFLNVPLQGREPKKVS